MEGFCGHGRFVTAIHSVERDVAIHSRNKREGTWWTYQEIAFGKHEKIFWRIAVKMMNVYSRTQTLVGFFRYYWIIGGQIDVDVLILMYCGEPVDLVRLGIVIEEKLTILPGGIIPPADVATETDDGRGMVGRGGVFCVLHL